MIASDRWKDVWTLDHSQMIGMMLSKGIVVEYATLDAAKARSTVGRAQSGPNLQRPEINVGIHISH